MEINSMVLEELEGGIKRAQGLAFVAMQYTHDNDVYYGRPAFHALEVIYETLKQVQQIIATQKGGEAEEEE